MNEFEKAMSDCMTLYAASLEAEVRVLGVEEDCIRIVLWDVDHTNGTPSSELYVRAIMEMARIADDPLDVAEWDIDFEVCDPDWFKLEAVAVRRLDNLVDVPFRMLAGQA